MPLSSDVRLQDVLITHELLVRSSRPASLTAEKAALQEVARQIPLGNTAVLRSICKIALEHCQAGSVGINLLVNGSSELKFDWTVIEGTLASYQGTQVDTDHSPCGYVIQRKSAQLLSGAGRYFEWMNCIEIPIYEALIVPLFEHDQKALGTIWAVSHDNDRHFDRADLHILGALSGHAAAALKLHAGVYQQ